jgi:sulfatase maturation enzyme AslB (radical SAM superfamily)
MELYKKNLEYSYHYIEPETGYSLLYSKASDSCVTLDPIATVLWKESGDVVDVAVVSDEFVKAFDIDNAFEYMPKIVRGMCRSGILVMQTGQDQDQEKRASDGNKTSEYPLETINFYATEECNARCYHCYQQTKNVGSSALPVHSNQINHKTFLDFVEKTVPLGLRSVKLSGGEPLLRADIEDIVTGLRTLGLSVCIESNGFLMTERLADLLAREASLVAISLDAGSAARHDKLRGLPGSFDKGTQSMRMLSSKGAKVQAIMTLSRLNVSDLESTIAVASENGCKSFKINMLVTLGGAVWLQNNRVLLDMREILEVYKKMRG